MRRRWLAIAAHLMGPVLLIAIASSPVAAQEAAPTVEAYEKTMKEIDYVLGDVELHVDAMYWADLGADTDALRSLFARVLAFWEVRQASEAVGLVERALAATSTLSRASMESDKAAAGRAVGELKAACKACHSEYREKTDDGYRIRPGG
jgi:hypothetical protein